MKSRYRRFGSFVPQYAYYDAKQGLLPMVLSDKDGNLSDGYFLLADPMQEWMLQSAGDRFAGFSDTADDFLNLYLLADGMLYPVGYGLTATALEYVSSGSFGSGSGSAGYGLELV